MDKGHSYDSGKPSYDMKYELYRTAYYGKANSLENKESVHIDFMVNAIGGNLTGQ
ncbi:hypothetical protein BMS3Bbin05_00240 [bacterium BMS3Bbin05]|nr:hypothetical protein BMS3Abin11_00002 [bacterium BMS3Abin11]GBE31340.1 hypothetical protein BMS3Bbin05_00240 [bacterium BMS3Bbin05]